MAPVDSVTVDSVVVEGVVVEVVEVGAARGGATSSTVELLVDSVVVGRRRSSSLVVAAAGDGEARGAREQGGRGAAAPQAWPSPFVASWRRPQWGQSLTSMPISCSQRRHSRRFSGVRSSAEAEGASGSDAGDGPQLLAGLAVDVDAVDVGLDERLAAGGGRAQPVGLAVVHRGQVIRWTSQDGRSMKVLIFHGYLLRGTGSNVYNANVAQALARLGHEVHLLCQDLEAASLPWVDAVGDWRSGALRVDGHAGRGRDHRLHARHRRPPARPTSPTSTRASAPAPSPS